MSDTIRDLRRHPILNIEVSMTYVTSVLIFLIRSSIVNVCSDKFQTVNTMVFNRNNHSPVSSEGCLRIAQCISPPYTGKKQRSMIHLAIVIRKWRRNEGVCLSVFSHCVSFLSRAKKIRYIYILVRSWWFISRHEAILDVPFHSLLMDIYNSNSFAIEHFPFKQRSHLT
jgi:hypothetical protein